MNVCEKGNGLTRGLRLRLMLTDICVNVTLRFSSVPVTYRLCTVLHGTDRMMPPGGEMK